MNPLAKLSAKALILLRALAEHSRIILPDERDAAEELRGHKLIEPERRLSAIMRPCFSAMRDLYLLECRLHTEASRRAWAAERELLSSGLRCQ